MMLSGVSLSPWQVGSRCRLIRFHHPSQLRKGLAPTRSYSPSAGWPGNSQIGLQKSSEVQAALGQAQPIVALETTIYTHGFPYPENVALALDLEDIVRQHGAVPATIGVLDGQARVGLNRDEIITLASSAGKPETMKVSRRDLPYILGMGHAGQKMNGGTTVAATMLLAQKAGIHVFGTGGLGGVHRGGQDTMDISADLTELGRTNVAVISSGCKSFLDIPRTLEYLETQGTTVCTFSDGRTGDIEFPAFFTRDSGIRSPMVVHTPQQAAAITYAQLSLGQENGSGMLFANPIPEQFSIPKSEIDEAINQAVKEAADQGFHGHANTPFILSRIKELTKGNSLPANRALIESNVAMAAKVAVELSKMLSWPPPLAGTSTSILLAQNGSKLTKDFPRFEKSQIFRDSGTIAEQEPAVIEGPKVPIASGILIFGSVAVDTNCDYTPDGHTTDLTGDDGVILPQMYTSNIAAITPSIGGVGHNVALAAHLVGGGVPVTLASYVADDLAGNTVLAALTKEGLDQSLIEVLPTSDVNGVLNRTAQYIAINDTRKDLVLATADMSIFDSTTAPFHISSKSIKNYSWIVVDANWHPSIQSKIMAAAKACSKHVAFEPVSSPKASSIFHSTSGVKSTSVFPSQTIDLATPNQYELSAMHTAAKKNDYFESAEWWEVIDALGIPSSGARDRFLKLTNQTLTDEGIPLMMIQLLPFIPNIITKLGSEGVLLTKLLKSDDPQLTDPKFVPYILSRCTNGSKEIGGVYMRLFPAEEVQKEDIISVNGVGDTFLGVIVAGLCKGRDLDAGLISIAQKAAVMTLKCKEAVSPDLAFLDEL